MVTVPTDLDSPLIDGLRALTSDETQKCWGQRRNSSHQAPPGIWIQIWQSSGGSMSTADYPLDIWAGPDNNFRATEKALERFLYESARGTNAELEPETLFKMGEYVGLSAFLHPQQALNYGNGTLFRLTGRDRYAAFQGVRTGTLMDDVGAVIIEVSDWGSTYGCREFCDKFGLQIPQDAPVA